MEAATKTFLELFEKQIMGSMEAMEKRLEGKIDALVINNKQSHKEIQGRNADFRADIKQLYGRVDLIEKGDVKIEGRVLHLEVANKEGKETSKFKWEIFIGLGGMIVAIIAVAAMFLQGG